MTIKSALTILILACSAPAFAAPARAAEADSLKAKPGEFDLSNFLRDQDKAGPAGSIGHTSIPRAKKPVVAQRRMYFK